MSENSIFHGTNPDIVNHLKTNEQKKKKKKKGNPGIFTQKQRIPFSQIHLSDSISKLAAQLLRQQSILDLLCGYVLQMAHHGAQIMKHKL